MIADNLNNYLYVDFHLDKRKNLSLQMEKPIILLNNSLKNSNEIFTVMAHELKHAIVMLI